MMITRYAIEFESNTNYYFRIWRKKYFRYGKYTAEID